jgi:hypothetical protein
MINIIKNLNDLEDLKKPIKGFTYFGDKKGNLITLTHIKTK